jgi:hypothetical protein
LREVGGGGAGGGHKKMSCTPRAAEGREKRRSVTARGGGGRGVQSIEDGIEDKKRMRERAGVGVGGGGSRSEGGGEAKGGGGGHREVRWEGVTKVRGGQRALKWFRRAGEGGHPWGAIMAAECYASGSLRPHTLVA